MSDKTARARELLATAKAAAADLESSVRELVAMRAWDLLGYTDFCEMWEVENGYPAPNVVRVLAVQTLSDEGRNTSRTGIPNGHRTADMAQMVGLPVKAVGGRSAHRHVGSGAVSTILKQLDHGVPPEHIILSDSSRFVDPVIEKYGTRKRAQPRRIGKAPTEMVVEGFTIHKRDAQEIAEIARQADVPKAEIYRQAVAEYLARIRESRAVAS